MKRHDFQSTNYKSPADGKPASHGDVWTTPEGIDVPSAFTKADFQKLEHTHYVAGLPPYLRGPYSTMYVSRPWTIRQYAGFSTAE
ncbi:MAG TPA: methylmalonyl-CoA mutase, partial [Cryomorphaceae bacterium]|nr:methylmalonyl-CoA mutase [Cryomorphaceae bacterium]